MPEETKLKEFYTMREVGSILSVHERTVRNWINQGKIEALVFDDGRKRISKKELKKFIKERTQARKE